MLYLVPTPIGNLQDITLRAIEILKNADVILAEDTRNTGGLLKHYGIETRMRAYHAHNEHKLTDSIIGELQKGLDFALVTDAGMPGISDPGFLLVRACFEAGIQVSPLPGPTALIAALAGSGLPCDRFHFEGFLPHKKGRKKRWEFLKSYPYTIVLYEAPYRLIKTLEEASIHLGLDRRVCVAKEISKIFESFITDSIGSQLDRLREQSAIKGEYVLVIEGSERASEEPGSQEVSIDC